MSIRKMVQHLCNISHKKKALLCLILMLRFIFLIQNQSTKRYGLLLLSINKFECRHPLS